MSNESNPSRRDFLKSGTAVAAGVALALNGRNVGAAGPADDRAKQTPAAKQHDVGAIFGKKPYFPMILSNGIDNVLIGYSGSMGACQGHEAWNYANMKIQTIGGWYRADIVRKRFVENLLQCGYVVRQGIHADGIETAQQWFDPKTSVLTTRCNMQYADVQVTTFLTRDHLLVHRFAVHAHRGEMALQFFVRTPNVWAAFPLPPVSVLKANVAPAPEDAKAPTAKTLEFTIEGPGWPNTPGRVFCDHPEVKRVTTYNGYRGLEVPLAGQCEFTFAVQCSLVQDVPGGAKPEPLADRFDYGAALQRHSAEWETFDSRSSIHLPHNGIEDVYRTSLYVIRAHQHPVVGGIILGAYPDMWNNGVGPSDMSFGMMGLLGANRMKEAELGVQYDRRLLPTLVRPQTPEALHEDKHLEKIQISLQAWQFYLYSGRLSALKDYWDCVMQPVEFMMSNCIVEFEDHAEIIRSSGPNGKERVNGKVVHYANPTCTLLDTIEALRGACAAADLLGRPIDPRWRKLLPKLERGLEVNRIDGALREARSPKASPTCAFSQVGLFGAPMDKQAVLASIAHFTSREGFQTWANHGYRVVPWFICDASAALSRLGMTEEAARHAEMAAQFTTTLNGFPEAVRPDGVYVKTWYATIHGDFVHAVNLLLLQRRNDAVELFPGVPAAWGDVSFESLRAPVGLVVSASRTAGKIVAKVLNDGDRRQQFRVRACNAAKWEQAIALEPGQSVSLPR